MNEPRSLFNSCTIRRLVQVRQFYRDHPNGLVQVDWCTHWNQHQYQRWFMSCLLRKINRQQLKTIRRKDDEEWQRQAGQVARRLADRNVVRVHECPRDLRTRLAHRLYDE